MVLKAAKNAIIIFLLLGIVCGVGYPALVTVIAQKAFPEQANGSIVYKDGKPVGSRLIGQEWTQPKYFWGRPSAIPGGANNAMTSTSSNDGPTSPWLINKVRDRVAAQRKANPDAKGPVPQDLATTSASGLDPDITPEDALWQVERVAKARKMKKQDLEKLVHDMTEEPFLGFLGKSASMFSRSTWSLTGERSRSGRARRAARAESAARPTKRLTERRHAP